MPILPKLLNKIETEWTLPNEATRHPDAQSNKDSTKKENYRWISLMNIFTKVFKIFLQIESNNIPNRSIAYDIGIKVNI